MSERNIIQGAAGAAFAPFIEQWEYEIVWLVAALVLVLADLRFGIMAAQRRGEKIRGSRAIRRTINKMVDYICWMGIAIVLGGSFGKMFGIPLLAGVIMLIICGIELSSIFDNYFEYKGVKKRLNIFKFVSKLFRIPEIEESIEDVKEE